MHEQEPQITQTQTETPETQLGMFENQIAISEGQNLWDGAKDRLRSSRIGYAIAVGAGSLALAAGASAQETGETPPPPPVEPLPFKECAQAAKKADVVKLKMDGYKLNFVDGYEMSFVRKKFFVKLPKMPEGCEGNRRTITFIKREINGDKKSVSKIKTYGNKAQKEGWDGGRSTWSEIGNMKCAGKNHADFDVKRKVVYTDRTLDKTFKKSRTYFKRKFRYSC